MSRPGSRDGLEAAVLHATRALSRQSSLFSQAVADRLGLALTDVEVLDLLADAGPVTAGRLSELSALTSGATTRLIDRLEQAGYVHRVADPADRRRVLVEAVPERMRAIATLHDSIREAQRNAIADSSDDELRLFLGFLERATALAGDEARKLREPEERDEGKASFAAPLAGISKARLVFLSAAPNVSLRGDAAVPELYRGRFEGPVPRVRLRGAVVTVTYPRFGWLDWRARIADVTVDASVHWRKDRGEILLNSRVRWGIELRGGVSRLDANLSAIDLESFDLRGGASKLSLTLPAPAGVVPIRIAGGVNYLTVRRPKGAAIGLTLKGGASYVGLDGEHIRGTGSLSMESPGAAGARDRYELEVVGGANKIIVADDAGGR